MATCVPYPSQEDRYPENYDEYRVVVAHASSFVDELHETFLNLV